MGASGVSTGTIVGLGVVTGVTESVGVDEVVDEGTWEEEGVVEIVVASAEEGVGVEEAWVSEITLAELVGLSVGLGRGSGRISLKIWNCLGATTTIAVRRPNSRKEKERVGTERAR